MTSRRIDPEPITIFMAIAAAYSAAVASVNYVKTHHKSLPSKVRARLLVLLKKLEDQAKGLRADLRTVEGIFRNAEFYKGRKIQFGNGAQLTDRAFSEYEVACDKSLRRLRDIHKLSLTMERTARKLGSLDMGPTTNVLGNVYTRVEKLLESKNLSIDRAWRDLEAIADGLDRAIKELRKQLSVD
jgi:hypothetical protein